jgi:hypothetical protein
MILHPGILALCASSLLTCLMTVGAACYGVLILSRWDLTSGSELQLALERRTYLISTIVGYFLAFQLVSLFLFIHTADSICHLFVGAMCAVGTLTANSFGYPTLLLKVVTFILAGLWLILNHADNRGYDYPLIRAKYLLLLFTAPFVLAEAVVQSVYFLWLRPDIITSCCGTLFSQGARGIAADIAALPGMPMKLAFYSCIAVTCVAGARFCRQGTGGYLVAILSGATFVVSITAMISFISLYVYDMPSHHCPFCILQKEYDYVGYPLYGLMLLGTVTGLGVGLLQPCRTKASLEKILPAMQKKLAAVSVTSFILFTFMVTWQVLFADLKLEGY